MPTSYGYVPRYTYSDLTMVPAGGAGFLLNVAPTMAPGFAPLFPPLPSTPSVAGSVPAPAIQPMAGTNEVTALPMAASSSRVPMQAVLAALILALTTAALVRTWVLRHTNM